MVEVLLTPLTYWIMNKVKAFEGINYYDRDTDFNPFSFKM